MQPTNLRKTTPGQPARALVIFLFCILTRQAMGQCITTSTVPGRTFANNNTIAGSAFSSPNNVGAEDGSAASASTLLSVLGSAKTNLLQATDFGFNIPPSAIICGVSVWIKKRALGINIFNSISDEQVQLVVGGTPAGNNVAGGAPWSSSAAFSSYGSSSNTWGTTLTPAQVNSPHFGVAIAASYSGLAGVILTAEVDYIMMQVNYTPSVLPLVMGPFTTIMSGNTVSNKWTMYEEEKNGQINLQQSKDGSTWQTINSYKLQDHFGNRKYEVTHKLINTGSYFYRLELIHASGEKTYSRINSVHYKNESGTRLYPNPSGSYVKLFNEANKGKPKVFNSYGQQQHVPFTQREKEIVLDVNSLKRGSYFIVMDNSVFSFLKI